MVRESLDLGRECDGLILDDPKVSRRHAQLSLGPQGLTITDLGSTNGTLHNGRQIAAPTAVAYGDEVTLGSARIRIDPAWHLSQQSAAISKSTTTRGTIVAGVAATQVESTGEIAGGAVKATLAAPPPAVNPMKPVTPTSPESSGRRTSIDIVADAVSQSRLPDVASLMNDEGTLTIVFSDIESSTEMAASVGDNRWMQVLDVHNTLIRSQVEAFGGSEIKSQGDGFMLSFPSARRALMCMMRVQHEITAHAAAHPDTGVRVRIGLHTGEVILTDDGDLFGRHVIMAARIAGQAKGGQILVSGLVRQITEGGGDLPYGDAMPTQLKGLGDQAYDVFEVKWQEYSFD